MHPIDPHPSSNDILPTIDDRSREDVQESELLDDYHRLQPQVLGDTFRPPNYLLEQIIVAHDVKLAYDPHQRSLYKRPDWFAIVGIDQLDKPQGLTRSYRPGQEGVNPFVVVELLTPDTEKEDLGHKSGQADQYLTKWDVYERIFRVPYYILFDGYTNQLRVFQLVGIRYVELDLKEPRIWMHDIQLGLGLWQGVYQGIERLWLRWYDAAGKWILTPEERERQQAERLMQQLRDLGIEPNWDI